MSLWDFLSQSAVVEPVATVVGGALGVVGKVWLDRRKARREDADRSLKLAELAGDATSHQQLERAAERDHQVVTSLLDGLGEIRDAVTANHDLSLQWIREERKVADERHDRVVARLERLTDNAVKALAAVTGKAEIRRG